MSFHGRFIWYELLTSDVTATKAFYSKFLGWTFDDMDMGGPIYSVVNVEGAGVGGMMGITPEIAAMGVPPCWTGYVAVDDCDASAAKVKTLGGSVMREPADIPGIGRFAIVADSAGAAIAIMTPRPPEGARPEVPKGAVGSSAWRELYGTDPKTGFSFYADLFGWTADEAMDMGPEHGVYQLFSNQDGQVGGMMKKPGMVPVACWTYYFQVDDVDAQVEPVKAGGGQVLMGPMDVPGGRVFQATDPQGAVFALYSGKAQ